MVHVMAERCDLSCERGRKLGVYEKAQSRAPQDGVIVLLGGELQDRGDVFCFKVGIIRQNLFARGARSEQVKDVLDADPQPTNRPATAAHIRIYRDAIKRTHENIVPRGAMELMENRIDGGLPQPVH